MSEHNQNHDHDESASMDSDYGSSPRVGVDNCAATQVNLGGWQAALSEMFCVCRNHATKAVKDQPATALLAAAAAGFLLAGVLRSRK